MAERRGNNTTFVAATLAVGLLAVLANTRRSLDDTPAGKAHQAPYRVQATRARELGRGRHARTPFHIPWRGWKDILWRSYLQFNEDRLLAVAAGVVFFGLLAIFPAVTALVSSYGLFADTAAIAGHLAAAATLMPSGAFDLVQEQALRLIQKGGGQLSFGFILGLLLAIWSANAGMKAIIDALNVIYGEREKRNFFHLNIFTLLLTLFALGLLLLGMAATVAVPVIFDFFGVSAAIEPLVKWLRWPVLLASLTVALAALYRYGPSRRSARWRWVLPGSIVAALLWVASSALFSFYLANFANYGATYGSLGAGIGLMMWLWVSAIVVLLGAELNSEIEHQTARDTTVGREKPLGVRGAMMADTVGAAQDWE